MPSMTTIDTQPPYPLPHRLDVRNSAAVGKAISELIEGSPQSLILDARDLAYISSKGVHTLRRLRICLQAAGGALTVVGPRPFVREVLTYGGLGDILQPMEGERPTGR